MKVITIKGAKNTGKTTLLKYAYKNLLTDGADIIEYDCSDFLTEDIYAYLIWRGLKIVIFSIGDSIEYVKKGIEKANFWKVDVLVNALTTTISEDQYRILIPEKEFSITMDEKSDKEDRVQHKQYKYFNELLPKLKDICSFSKD